GDRDFAEAPRRRIVRANERAVTARTVVPPRRSSRTSGLRANVAGRPAAEDRQGGRRSFVQTRQPTLAVSSSAPDVVSCSTAALTQTWLSWNAPPPHGAGWSAPVTVLIPLPSSKASFGHTPSEITTPRWTPLKARACRITSPRSL